MQSTTKAQRRPAHKAKMLMKKESRQFNDRICISYKYFDEKSTWWKEESHHFFKAWSNHLYTYSGKATTLEKNYWVV